MSKAEEYEQEIRKRKSHSSLLKLWEDHKKNGFDDSFWKKGKVLEYVVLRAFELEIDKSAPELEKMGCARNVSYPYDVEAPDYFEYKMTIEQIDGAIHIDGLHALVECKDYSNSKISIESLAKMRNQLARRHGSVFGMFFSTSGYSTPAEILVSYMAPQLIILWTIQDIEYCLKNERFIKCMKEKYRKAIENCEYNYAFYVEDTDLDSLISYPLF